MQRKKRRILLSRYTSSLLLILLSLGCIKAVTREGPCHDAKVASADFDEETLALGGFIVGAGGAAKDSEIRLAAVFKVYASEDGSFKLDAFVPLKAFLLEEFEQVTAHIMTVPGEEIIVPLQHPRIGLLEKMQLDIEKAKETFKEPSAERDLLALKTQLNSFLLFERQGSDSELLESTFAKMRLRRLQFTVDLATVKSKIAAHSFDAMERFSHFQQLTSTYEKYSGAWEMRDLYELTEQVLRLKQWAIAIRMYEDLAVRDSFLSSAASIDQKIHFKAILDTYGKVMRENCTMDSYEHVLSADGRQRVLSKCFHSPEGSVDRNMWQYDVKGDYSIHVGKQISFVAGEFDNILQGTNFESNRPRADVQTVITRTQNPQVSQQVGETWFASINPRVNNSNVSPSNISYLLLEEWPEDSEPSVEKGAGPRVILQTIAPQIPLSETQKKVCASTATVSVNHWPLYTIDTGCIVFYAESAEEHTEPMAEDTGAPPVINAKKFGGVPSTVRSETEGPGDTPTGKDNQDPNSIPVEIERPRPVPAKPVFSNEAISRTGQIPCVQ